jgi:hypothetical protein
MFGCGMPGGGQKPSSGMTRPSCGCSAIAGSVSRLVHAW